MTASLDAAYELKASPLGILLASQDRHMCRRTVRRGRRSASEPPTSLKRSRSAASLPLKQVSSAAAPSDSL